MDDALLPRMRGAATADRYLGLAREMFERLGTDPVGFELGVSG